MNDRNHEVMESKKKHCFDSTIFSYFRVRLPSFVIYER